ELPDLLTQRVRHPRQVGALAGGRRDDPDPLVHLVDERGDRVDGPGGVGGGRDGGVHLPTDARGGAGGLVGERAHLVGDDGEAAPGVPGAAGLDGRVEGEHAGLGRDLADEGDGLRGRRRGLLQRAHRLQRVLGAADGGRGGRRQAGGGGGPRGGGDGRLWGGP